MKKMIADILGLLKTWAHRLQSESGTDGVYAFGSLIYKNGSQFGTTSDIDLIVRFPPNARTALERLVWLEDLHNRKRDLEFQLAAILGRNPSKPISSFVVATNIEINGDLHKDRAPTFFTSSQFFNVLTDTKTSEIPGAGSNRVTDQAAQSCIQFAQKTRNLYLDVAGNGVSNFLAFSETEPLPKDIMRHAAMIANLSNPGKELGAQFDTQIGLDFVSNGLYQIRMTAPYVESLHDRLSIRRGARGTPEPIDPRDRVFLVEWLFDQALEALDRRRSELFFADPIPADVRDGIMAAVTADLTRHGWRVDKMEEGQGCTNPAFNLRVTTTRPYIRLQPVPRPWTADEHFSDDLRIFAVSEARKKASEVFNHKKIRLASDFIDKPDIAIQETDYFSSMMTDQLAWLTVRSKELSADGATPKQILWNGVSAFIERSATTGSLRLMGLQEASISNQLGASTLAFSSDGHLLVVYQSDKNQQSKNVLAPSGSGSLDWSDLASSSSSDLLSLVRYGANRELEEECALDDDHGSRNSISSKVMVIGFARMLHRAGKPEFFCLGWIAAPAHEIINRKPERYVECVVKANVERANWNAGKPREEIIRVCQAYLNETIRYKGSRVPLSYPLGHGLSLLVEVCRDDYAAVVVDHFIQTAQ
jgi:predicted nucleotidyltransferase